MAFDMCSGGLICIKNLNQNKEVTLKHLQMKELKKRKLEQLHPVLQSWYTPEQLSQNIEIVLQEEMDRITDQDFARGFFEHCQIPGTDPEDYFNRLQDALMTGIRFRGLDLSRPFVDVILTPQMPSTLEAYREVALQAAHRHQKFAPKHARFYVPSHVELGPLPADMFWEKRYLARPMEDLKKLPLPARFSEVELQVPQAIDFEEAYLQTYQEMAAIWPDHPEFATPESRETLEALMEQETLFEVFHQEEWIGVMAACRAEEQGLSGFVVVEMLIKPAFQGRGLGEAAQRHLIELLPARPMDAFYGTIDARNTPAIRAALKNGRMDVGGDLWVTL